MNFGNIRKDCTVGVLEDEFLDIKHSLHFSEWWNGEGLDLCFDDNNRVSLHANQLRLLVTALYLTKYVDFDECKENANFVAAKSAERERKIIQMRNDMRGFTCSPTKWDE